MLPPVEILAQAGYSFLWLSPNLGSNLTLIRVVTGNFIGERACESTHDLLLDTKDVGLYSPEP